MRIGLSLATTAAGIALLSVARVLGAGAVRFNNFDAKAPIYFRDALAWGTNLHVQVLGGPAGVVLHTLTDTNGIPWSVVGLAQPGYFDAGVALVPGVRENDMADFELIAWWGGDRLDSAAITVTLTWRQSVGSYPSGSQGQGPAPLEIPHSLTIAGATVRLNNYDVEMDTNQTVGAAFYPLELPLITVDANQGFHGVSADGFNLLLFGEPGRRYVVQASANLLDWASRSTLDPTNGPLRPVRYLDRSATNFSRRLYRAKED